jgi:PAS domain S-box-containing protein
MLKLLIKNNSAANCGDSGSRSIAQRTARFLKNLFFQKDSRSRVRITSTSTSQVDMLLSAWVNSIPLASFVVDSYSRVHSANSSCKKLFSAFRTSDFKMLASGQCPAWIHPSDISNALDLFSCLKHLKSGIVESRLRIRGEEGDWIWLHIKLKPLEQPDFTKMHAPSAGRLTLGTCEDITLFQNAIHAIRDRESRSKRLLSGIHDAAVLILCEDGFIQFSNDAVLAVLGYTEDELKGKHISILCPETDLLTGKVISALATSDGLNFHQETTRKIKKSGQGFWAGVLVTSLSSDSCNTKNYCVVIRDVSNYKREQKELHEWKTRFEQLAENVREAFWIYDVRAASLIYISPVVKPLLNIEPSSGELFFSEVLKSVYPDDSGIARNFFSDLTLGLDSRIEFRIKKSENEIRWMSFKSFGVKDSAARVHRIIGVAEDVTESKNSQDALKTAKEAADAANKAKSEFLANMSHEIRTPLGAIMGFAELVGNFQSSDDERHSALQAIQRNGRQLGKIIDEILDLSKVEAGKLEIEEEEIELFSFVNDVTTLLELQAKEKGIALRIEKSGGIPATIKTDGTKFRQILINIAGNAVKFTNRGSVTIEVSATVHPKQSMLIVRITDSGLGMTEDQQHRIFKPFVQADSSTRRKFGGTGLGLVLSKRLAQLLGGDLTLAWSEEGRGSCFEISINIGPAHKLNIKAAELGSQAGEDARKHVKSTPRLDGSRILVVDDAPDNRLIVQKFLTHAGACVDYAEDGRSAAKMAIENQYDLIVMDIQMPEYDGYQTISHIRRHGYGKPVIALSAHAMREDRERSISYGFNEHLCKPVDRMELLGSVRQLIDPA